ncbi:MAG: c-type cytochrome [Acidobacteriota bacterium]
MMSSKWIKTAVIAAGLGAMVAAAAAGAASEAKGKYYAIKTCKPCHGTGSPHGEVTPLIHTSAQWKAYFAKGKHDNGKEELTKYLTKAQLADVEAFFVNHASDSPQPMTCGG